MVTQLPLPGDYAVVSIGGEGGRLIALGERLCGAGFSEYQHTFIYIGDGQIVEAEPGGARCRKVPLPGAGYGTIRWSTGHISLTPLQRAAVCKAARGYIGTPYSVADYFAIAAHRLHLWTPGLKAYIASTHHQICSQLVDQCFADAGVHLFTDGRWPGYVLPSDLAELLGRTP